ncbi:lactate permease [Moraxella cuniculi DSM 21768]|uniref:L-lactate permease n=1 Tax=Moraxella cuniculi DSM 21768 TaxID=1122245 RepID=A0A1N7EM69_9GAMM|nr:L-lactate permease [Moraxella cuniculi]OOS07755.1 lactate permease [Moraxella cuniculi]SIR89149.1 lactate permease [Moraxella cuniculi DSM 21768]
MYTFLAMLPILIVFTLLVVMRLPAKYAMSLAYAATAALSYFVWQTSGNQIAAATIHGVLTAVNVLFIVFSAILILNTLKQSGAITAIRRGFMDISPDRRVQMIIVAWLFGCLIEGSTGWGTPSAVAAPLLLALGFPAMACVMAVLIIQSTPVSYGAVGTPLLIGVNSGLENKEDVAAALANAGMDLPAYIFNISGNVGFIHSVVGFLIPLILCGFLTLFFGQKRSFTEGLKAAPFAIFAGLAFTIPYYLTAKFIGPELPSIVGAVVGMALVIPAAKRGFLVPKETFDFAPRETWAKEWVSEIAVSETQNQHTPNISVARAFLPYLIIIGILIATRTIAPLKAWLTSDGNSIIFANILGTSITNKTQLLYSPATVLLLVSMICIVLFGMKADMVKKSWSDSGKTMIAAAPALLFSVPMVQVFINSGTAPDAAVQILAMPKVLATSAATAFEGMWPLFAPWIGSLGAFIAGSNTVSNMMFAHFQWGTATQIGLDVMQAAQVVSLQAVGGAAGNMISVHNVVAACAVVGLVNREGYVIRKTLIAMVYYVLQAGLVGMAIIFSPIWWLAAIIWPVLFLVLLSRVRIKNS